MFRLYAALVLSLVFGSMNLSLSAQATLISEQQVSPQILRYTLNSPSVGKNTISSSSTVSLQVILPPGYNQGSDKFPVVYYLHGHGGNPQQVRGWLNQLNQAFKGIKGFILVGVDGKNKLNGGFYVNSPITGLWEDWVVKEAVPFIDSTLRTIPKPESRGLFGFSMGGYGVLNLGLKHPQIFSTVFSVAPGVVSPDTPFEDVYATWDGSDDFLSGYAGAFAGDIRAIPSLDGSAEDLALQQKWLSGFGQWEKKVDAYLGQPARLKAVALEWGVRDSYAWISTGSAWLAGYFPSRGIPVQAFEFSGGHQILPARLVSSVIPFFLTNLNQN